MNIVSAWLLWLVFLVVLWFLVFLAALLFSNRPKRMEQHDGKVYGYKILRRDRKGYYSPRGDKWRDGQLTADLEPSADNTNGIYAVANPDQLKPPDALERVVKVEMSGTVVQHKDGARSQRARIVKEL